MLPRRRSIFRIWKGCGRFISGADVADRPDVDLAARQEGHGAVEIDGEAALDAVEDHAFDALAGFVFLLEPRPALLAPRLLARQHGLAHGVLDALKIDVDLVADGEVGGAAGDAKFFQGNAAFGLEADIDDGNVLLDRDDGALDDVAFLERRGGQRLFKQCRELVVARMADTLALRLVHQNSLVPSNRNARLHCRLGMLAKARGQACPRLTRRMRSTARISRKTSEMVCQCERGAASTGVPCTAHRSVDQIDGSPECGVYIQIRSIEQVRVRGPAQGRRGAVLVPFVAPPDIGQHFGFAYGDSGLFQLDIAPPGAFLRRRRHK